MSLNKNDRASIEKEAKKSGYTWNSSGSAMTSGNNSIKFSPTGGSVTVGSSTYSTAADAKKSKSW